jgi:hypothetical protein
MTEKSVFGIFTKPLYVRGNKMQSTIYQKLLDEVEKLTQTEQLRLLEQIACLIRRKKPVKTHRSILELQGLGKEIWKNIDAQQYVNEERKSWNG